MANETIDNEIIRLYLEGENSAIELIFAKYYSKFKSISRKYLCNSEDAEDMANNILLKLISTSAESRIKNFSNIKSLSSFFYTYVKFACLDELRKKQLNQISIEQAPQIEEISTDKVKNLEYKSIGLTNCQMEIFELYLEGMKVSEIAKSNNRNLSTVKNILQTAKQKILSHYKSNPHLIEAA